MNRARMIEWLASAFALYAVCITLRTFNLEPQAQVVLWKLGNVTVAAYVGYWIDRRAFTRVTDFSDPLVQLRRALVISAAMLAVSLGL